MDNDSITNAPRYKDAPWVKLEGGRVWHHAVLLNEVFTRCGLQVFEEDDVFMDKFLKGKPRMAKTCKNCLKLDALRRKNGKSN